jgi:hypothetical protein
MINSKGVPVVVANPVYIYADDVVVSGSKSEDADDVNMWDEVKAHAERTLTYQISYKSVTGVSMTGTAELHLQYRLDSKMDWQNVVKPDGSELIFTLANKNGDGSDWAGQVRGFNGFLRLAIKDEMPTVFVKAAIRG